MTAINLTPPGFSSDYVFESIILETDRADVTANLKAAITDISIYEHLDKPYLTGELTFADHQRVFESADILGGEKIIINIKSTKQNTNIIKKTFYISKILNNARSNDNLSIINLHLIEDIAFTSNLQNINKAYEGKTSDIISKIAKNYLGKEVLTTNNDKQNIKVIVPNLDPIEAVSWIKNRATTSDGYPFYLFSTFIGDELKYIDLGTMISMPVMNPTTPYKNWQSNSNSADQVAVRRTIQNFKSQSTEDLFTLIRNGLVGSNYSFIELSKGTSKEVKFDIHKDLMTNVIKLNPNQPHPPYVPGFLFNEIPFNELPSKKIYRIGGSSAYENKLSYMESNSIADYKLEVICNAMTEILKKSPLEVTVNGIDFIDADDHKSIGNNIKIEFLSTDPDIPVDKSPIDKKMSGDYLIFAVEHVFKKEKYDVKLTCVKLGSYKRLT